MKIIDSHAHLFSCPKLEDSEKAILSSMERYGISFSLLSNCDASEFPTGASQDVKRTSTLSSLKKLIAFVEKDPKSLGAAVWIRPVKEKGPSRELRKYVEENRSLIYALKFHPYAERTKITSPLLRPWLAWAEEERFPIIVHTAEDEWSDVSYLVETALAHPRLDFIAAHLQLCSDHLKGVEALRKARNLYGDTAWVPMEIAAKALRETGPNRILFGTDNPIDGSDTLANPIYQEYFRNAAHLSESLYRRLMEKNAISIFRLPC